YSSTHNGFVIIKALVKLVDGIEKLNDFFTQFLIIMHCLQAYTKFIDAIADNIIQVALVGVPAEGIIIVNDAFDDELVDASGIVVVLLLDIIIGDGFDAQEWFGGSCLGAPFISIDGAEDFIHLATVEFPVEGDPLLLRGSRRTRAYFFYQSFQIGVQLQHLLHK